MNPLPPDLLAAVSAPLGWQLAIVIGAGCSHEPPTAIPLAGAISSEANRKLVENGTLAQGECLTPNKLAALASLVFNKTGAQVALVNQLPLDKMRAARPNEGHRLLVALMAEGAVSHVLSLNFDLAVQNAAAEMGEIIHVVDTVGVPIPATRTIVQLHGSANAPQTLILREEVINDAWKASWQQIVANQILASPNILFVGLGSAAPVISETVAMIGAALDHQKAIYQIDINQHAQNVFAQALEVTATGLIVTTTGDLHAENDTRVLSLTANDTPAQTRRVMRAIARRSQTRVVDMRPWHSLQQWLCLSPTQVVVPFAPALAELITPAATRLRRGFQLLLSLIQAHALLHQQSREQRDGKVIAEIQDYQVVRALVADLISESVEATVSGETRAATNAVSHLQRRQGSASVAAVAAELGIDKSAASRRLAKAAKQGFVSNGELCRGKRAAYVTADLIPVDLPILPTRSLVAWKHSISRLKEVGARRQRIIDARRLRS